MQTTNSVSIIETDRERREREERYRYGHKRPERREKQTPDEEGND